MSRRATRARSAILRAMARDLLPDFRLSFASASTAERWREWAHSLRADRGAAAEAMVLSGGRPDADGSLRRSPWPGSGEPAWPPAMRSRWTVAVLPPIEIPQVISQRLEAGRLATGWSAAELRARFEAAKAGLESALAARSARAKDAAPRPPMLDAIAAAISERIATQPLFSPPAALPLFVPPTCAQRLRGSLRYGERVAADSLLWAYWQVRSLRRSPLPVFAADAASGLPTVIMLPGLATNWKFMQPLTNAIAAAGFPVAHLPQLRRVTKSSTDLAELVLRFLRTHRELGPVLLVSHSKGGLVAKRVLLADPEARLALGAVTISAPFDGARAARFVDGRIHALREVVLMRPGTPAMLSLARQTAANSRITTVSPIIDEIVGSRGTLPGARNLAVSSIGHNLLLADPRVHRLVVRELHRIVEAAAANETSAEPSAQTAPIDIAAP